MVSTFCEVGKEGIYMKELMIKIEDKWYESKLHKKLLDYKWFRKYTHKHHHMKYTKKVWGNVKYIQFTDDISVVVCFDKNKEKGYIVLEKYIGKEGEHHSYVCDGLFFNKEEGIKIPKQKQK